MKNKKQLLLVSFFILLLVGLSSCSYLYSDKKHKLLITDNDSNGVKSSWYCSYKMGFAGSPPNNTIVSNKALNEQSYFCTTLITRKLRHIRNKKVQLINIMAITSPQDLSTKIKTLTGINTLIHEFVDYDRLHKLRLSIFDIPDTPLVIDFISKKYMDAYKQRKCLYKPIDAYSRALGYKNYSIVLCGYNDKQYVVNKKLVAKRIK